MLRAHKLIADIVAVGVVAVVRTNAAHDAEKVARACLDGGITAVEVTFTTMGVHHTLERLYARFDGCILGAGSVLDSETARVAILSGASYIVSPIFDKNTALLCNRYAVPYMAGCYTPTEAVQAMEYGVDIIKLFPAGSVSPQSLKAFKGPIPQAYIMPTGGINMSNAREWILAGAIALGIGGDLITGGSVVAAGQAGDAGHITAKARAYKQLVADARAEKKTLEARMQARVAERTAMDGADSAAADVPAGTTAHTDGTARDKPAGTKTAGADSIQADSHA